MIRIFRDDIVVITSKVVTNEIVKLALRFFFFKNDIIVTIYIGLLILLPQKYYLS